MEIAGAVEFRVSGRVISGAGVRYGEVASDRRERFSAGAFVEVADPLALRLQHDPLIEVASTRDRMVVMDNPAALEVRAELLPGAALDLVRRRRLTGFSVEFGSLTEREVGGLRVIDRAYLGGIGLVDIPSYAGSRLELRQRLSEAWFVAEVPFERRLECTCQGGGCTSVRFTPEAFDEALASDRDILAVGGQGFASVLGSTRRGTLILEEGEAGLRVGLDGPTDSAAARQVVESARAGPVYARPIIDAATSVFEDLDTVRVFSSVALRGMLIKATPHDRGHQAATVRGVEQRRRRRIWL